MINGAHMIIYSTDAESDRDCLRDAFGLPHVDVGDGWLVFGLPASEMGVHPTDPDTNGKHEIYFMCENLGTFIKEASAKGLTCTDPDDQGWGIVTQVALPGGSTLGVYEPRHARP